IMEFKGLYSERLYFKDFQEKTGFKMEVVRLGKYKSAVEPFLDNEMSDNNREQISAYLNSLWNEMKSDISASRGISEKRLDTIADSLLARNPQMAKDVKLVDTVGYYDEYMNGIKNAIGISIDTELQTVTLRDYARYAANKVNK